MTGILIFVIIVAVPLLATILFMRQPAFGSRPRGSRLERIRHSPQYRNGSFQNQSHTPSLTGGAGVYTVMRDFFFGKHERKRPDRPVPVVRGDMKAAAPAQPAITWFGHSSYLLQAGGLNILVDPVFSERTSPVQYAGTRAFSGTHIFKVEDLPPVDVLLITHDHYDHLDYLTVRQLKHKAGLVVTSLGVGAHLERWGLAADRVRELDWGESVTVREGTMLTAAPARHFSGRGFRRNQTLWSSFILQAGAHRIYIGGDSGYDSHFAAIGAAYGPFDLAILESGQYNPYWAHIHMMPEETVQAAVDLKAKLLFPVHWGKFALATHPWDESIQRVLARAAAVQLPVLTPRIGERCVLDDKKLHGEWWREEGEERHT